MQNLNKINSLSINKNNDFPVDLTELVKFIEQIKQDKNILKQFVAYLSSAIENKIPLIIALPLNDNNHFYHLISYAIAILPADYKCLTRIYTDKSQLLKTPMTTNLIVIPDNIAVETLNIVRQSFKQKPTLLNHQGQLKGGDKIDDKTSSYADTLVEEVLASNDLQNPYCLQCFKQYLTKVTPNTKPEILTMAIETAIVNASVQNFKQLIKDTLANQLNPAWLNSYFSREQNASLLIKSAEYLLSLSQSWAKLEHKNLPHPIKTLYTHLKKLKKIPPSLYQQIITTANQLKPSVSKTEALQKNLEIYVRLADLIAHFKGNNENPLVKQLWQAQELSYFTPSLLEYLFNVVETWQDLKEDSGQYLIDKNGTHIFAQNKLPDNIAQFLHKNYSPLLNNTTFLQLSIQVFNLTHTEKLSPTESFAEFTNALLEKNLWYRWYQQLSNAIELSQTQKHEIALAWLNSPLWQNWNNNWLPPEPTLEAWHGVIHLLDNSRGLSISDLKTIIGRDYIPKWAKIVPFETKQLDDLFSLIIDFQAISLLSKVAYHHYHYDKTRLFKQFQNLENPKLSLLKNPEELQKKIDNEQILNQATKALSNNDSDNPCWDALSKKIKQWNPKDKHPLLALAEKLKQQQQGWKTLKTVIKNHPDFLKPAKMSNNLIIFPIINVANQLSGNGSLGIVTWEIIQMVSPEQRNSKWWQNLRQYISHYNSYAKINNVENRPKMALAYINKMVLTY